MNIKYRLSICLTASWLWFGPVVSAQTPSTEHSTHHSPAADSAAAEMASGEVRRLDKAQQKITLRHGEIRSLDMPPMSMIFRVREPTLLDGVQVGDKVLFTAIKDADGTYVVTSLKPSP